MKDRLIKLEHKYLENTWDNIERKGLTNGISIYENVGLYLKHKKIIIIFVLLWLVAGAGL